MFQEVSWKVHFGGVAHLIFLMNWSFLFRIYIAVLCLKDQKHHFNRNSRGGRGLKCDTR